MGGAAGIVLFAANARRKPSLSYPWGVDTKRYATNKMSAGQNPILVITKAYFRQNRKARKRLCRPLLSLARRDFGR